MVNSKVRLFIIIAPTASGKNQVAISIAPGLNAEIISIDSMKVYRGLDISTAKPKTIPDVKYHLIDVVDPWESFNLARFVEYCDQAIRQIVARGKQPLLVCGTPLYLKGLLSGVFKGPVVQEELRTQLKTIAQEKGNDFLHKKLQKVDPAKASQIHPNDLRRIIRALEVYQTTRQPLSTLQTQFNQRRPEYEPVMIGLKRERTDLRKRIEERVERMFAAGLVEETQRLLKINPPVSKQVQQAVGYKEVVRYLHKDISLEEAKALVRSNTWTLARRQMNWFKRFPETNWFDIGSEDTAHHVAKRIKGLFPK
ncbi:tRNA (adenosine(37)-N6)-dimethylallyltransferase MiaA [Planctomycetota bacterium]